MRYDIDLTADLNAQDDDGLGWSTLADATPHGWPWGHASRLQPLRPSGRAHSRRGR
jgi:hypothetical protein